MKQAWIKATKERSIPQMYSELSETNRKYIDKLMAVKKGYVTPKRLDCLKASVIKFCDVLELDVDKATKDDITKVGGLIVSKDCEMSIKTKQDNISDIREAFKFWFGEDEEFPKVVAGLKRPKGRGQLRLPDEMLNENKIFEMIKACPRSRDKFYIALIGLDGALRPVEARNIKWGDIKKDKYGYFIKINTAKESGDKSERTIRIIKSEPYFIQWNKEYPLDKTSDNYVFVTYSDFKQIQPSTMMAVFKKLKKKLKINSRFYQYLMRHSLLTEMSKDPRIAISVLKKFAGHSQRSSVIGEYQHFGDDDLKNMQLQYNDLVKNKEEEKKDIRKPVICPKCKTSNEYDAEFCINCNMALSQKRMIEVSDMFAEQNKRTEELMKRIELIELNKTRKK